MLALLLALSGAPDLRLELVRESLTGTHCRYREYVNGLPSDDYVVVECPSPGLRPPSPHDVGRGAGGEGQLRSVNGRPARREIIDHWIHDYDAETGALIRRIPFFFRAKPARVFDPNPVVTLNDPSLQDRNDAPSAVPAPAYFDVQLEDVDESGALRGPHVTLVDRQPRNIVPPDGSGPLVFDRGADGFEDVSAYFHIDRNQRYLQSLGYTGARQIAPYAIEVDAHSANGTDNSFFFPSVTEAGKGVLHFGEGGTDDAEDADLLVHEYGHAILEWIAPGTFAGAFASEARAFGEAFGDYWAYSAHAAARRTSGRDPYCFADWDARCWEDAASEQCGYPVGSDCLRRLDSAKTMADYDRNDASGVEHRNGAIFSSALREIHDRFGRQVADTIVIESLFTIPPRPTFADFARRLIVADQLLYLGSHVPGICSAMQSRGILETCDLAPRGELTHFQSTERGTPIPENSAAGVVSTLTITDPRAIERIYVRVDIAHTARGDLRIELIAPDGTVIVLHTISTVRTPDIHATFGLDAATVDSLDVLRGRSAAGQWTLVVADRRPRDTGTLLSWGLVIQFAGDTPSAERPRGERSQMIPGVAHVYGVGTTPFVSDVRIANPKSTPENATLIFTRSFDDGRTQFRAVQVALAPGQTAAFDDVVAGAFLTAGFGTLEVLGDVVVMSRTYVPGEDGTRGQQVPPNLETTVYQGPSLYVAPVAISLTGRTWRSNLGIIESGGAEGRVLVRNGPEAYDVPVRPYSNVQFAIPRFDVPVELFVLAGDARVSAYLSQVDNQSGDAIFIPAVRASEVERDVIAPVTSHAGWTSDVRMFATRSAPAVEGTLFGFAQTIFENFEPPAANRTFYWLNVLTTVFDGRLPFGALRLRLPPGVDAASRVARDGVSQFIPFLELYGPAEQHLVFIESADPYRTNIGIVTDRTSIAVVTIHDSAGTEVERQTLFATGGGMAQIAVTKPVTGGRAVVRFVAGAGQAYASLIDKRTGDATLVHGQ